MCDKGRTSTKYKLSCFARFVTICEKTLWRSVNFKQVFFKHFASKNQLPGLSVSGTLVENRLNIMINTLEAMNYFR